MRKSMTCLYVWLNEAMNWWALIAKKKKNEWEECTNTLYYENRMVGVSIIYQISKVCSLERQ